MIVDLHNHTRYCRHATGACEEYVAAAESNGCRVFAFSGHLPYPPDFSEPEPDCVIPEEDFPAYLEEVARLRRADPQAMLVLAAVEVDYIPEHEAWARSTLAGLELDFVIGSMHLLRGLPIDFSPPKLEHLINICGGTESFLEEYFDRMAHVAESGWADVIGHLDIFKKFDADLRTFPPRVVMPYAEQFLDRLAALPAENRPVLEINTAGCDRACAEPFPSAAIAAAAHVRGIELTLGSDSHAPDQVGRHGREATELLASCGVKGLTYFLAGERLRFAL